MVQLSHPYTTTGKIHSLTRWTFVGKVMSLLFNMPSRLVITFLPRSKRLLISWLQSPSAVILEHKKIKPDTVSIFSHLFAMKWWDQMPWSSFFECWVLNQLFLNITFVKKHPFFWVNQYFTKFAVNYSIVCIDHIIHSTIQGHLDCFQLLTINKQQWISPYLTYGDHLCALLLGIYRIENAVF